MIKNDDNLEKKENKNNSDQLQYLTYTFLVFFSSLENSLCCLVVPKKPHYYYCTFARDLATHNPTHNPKYYTSVCSSFCAEWFLKLWGLFRRGVLLLLLYNQPVLWFCPGDDKTKHPINHPEHLSNRKAKHWHNPQPTFQTPLTFSN